MFDKIDPGPLVISENRGRNLVIREQAIHAVFTLLLAQVWQARQFVISHDLDPIRMHEVHMPHLGHARKLGFGRFEWPALSCLTGYPRKFKDAR